MSEIERIAELEQRIADLEMWARGLVVDGCSSFLTRDQRERQDHYYRERFAQLGDFQSKETR